MSFYGELKFETMKGKTLKEAFVSDNKEFVNFLTDGNQRFRLYHSQDCCETVQVEDVCGDLTDIIGSPILLAEEVTFADGVNPEGVTPPEYQECFNWTFYKLATIKGSVTIRWHGDSNGYYSTSVSFAEIG